MHQWLPERLKKMKIKTDCTAKLMQEWYKKYFEKSVWVEKEYSTGDYVFVNDRAGYNWKAGDLAQETSKKLQPKKTGSLKVSSV